MQTHSLADCSQRKADVYAAAVYPLRYRFALKSLFYFIWHVTIKLNFHLPTTDLPHISVNMSDFVARDIHPASNLDTYRAKFQRIQHISRHKKTFAL